MSLPEPYYEDPASGIVIYQGDCRAILPLLDAVGHVITDPPYSASSHAMHESGRVFADSQDGLVRERLNFEGTTAESLRVLLTASNARRWAVFTMDEPITAALRVLPPDGWKYMRTGVWLKPNAAPQFSGDRPGMGWEPVVILHRAGCRTKWNGGGSHAVWNFSAIHGAHPTEKPTALYEAFVALFTDPGETILDPFMGSGTTLVAAKTLGRKAIGIELEAKWCEVAKRRIMNTEYKPRLLDYEPWEGKQGVLS